jgi:CRISPR-associated protein Cmr6
MSEGLRRRIAVDQSKEVSNPSLELQRYVEKIESGGGSTAKDKLFERVSGSKATEIYRKAYERWKSNLELMQATIVEVRCSNRVIVGLASENVLEASITLHPIYGMPILPGDGLKGLARHYFQEQSTGNPEQKKHVDVLFGDQNTKGSQAGGYISYLDAWWIPDGDPFVREIITVHHQKYYSKPKENAPTDFEDPIPVPYLSAQGRFLIAINGPTADWTELAKSVLLAARLGHRRQDQQRERSLSAG